MHLYVFLLVGKYNKKSRNRNSSVTIALKIDKNAPSTRKSLITFRIKRWHFAPLSTWDGLKPNYEPCPVTVSVLLSFITSSLMPGSIQPLFRYSPLHWRPWRLKSTGKRKANRGKRRRLTVLMTQKKGATLCYTKPGKKNLRSYGYKILMTFLAWISS